MDTDDNIIFKKIANGLYIGDERVNEAHFTAGAITAVLQVGGAPTKFSGASFRMMLNPNEQMNSELPQFIVKVQSVVGSLRALRNNNHNVLVICQDGRNLSLAVVGCYLISSDTLRSELVTKLEFIHCTEEQRRQHDEYARFVKMTKDPEFIREMPDGEYAAIIKARDERTKLIGLSTKSLKKVILNYSP